MKYMKEYISAHNGIYYRVNDFEATRQTLVFIHGLSGNSSAWEPYEQEFMDKYNLLCIDLRGHGRSKKYSKEKDYAMGLFVNDIEELFDYLKIEKCIIISHSFGSVIAVGLIQRDPDRIKGAIFLAPTFKSKRALSTLSMRLVSGIFAFFSRALPISSRPGKRIDYSRLLPTYDWDVRRYLDPTYAIPVWPYISFAFIHSISLWTTVFLKDYICRCSSSTASAIHTSRSNIQSRRRSISPAPSLQCFLWPITCSY